MDAVLTIGQLARYAGVSTKTVRVYHDKGLLPEPERDSSGYRRYAAHHAIELIKIRTLAEAGVPLARIRELRAASDEEFRHVLDRVDGELSARIRGLRETRRRLRQLAAGPIYALPPEVGRHLGRLPAMGFSPRWVAMETDLWILVFATHPDIGIQLFHDRVDAMSDPGLRQIYLDYDRVHGLEPDDPRLDDLARRIAAATRSRYGQGDLPGQAADADLPALIQSDVNASSRAWQRLDRLIRDQLGI
jgi:DNA-binding transcriptional MerR regulator